MNGIYVLANDCSREWLIAWFESVRAKGCRLPVCIIPFDERMGQVERIAARYGAEILTSDSFGALDTLGLEMTENVRHGHFFRKLAMFDGPFDTFVYADSDMLALMNWDELVTRFAASNADLWYCGLSSDMVYKPGPLWDELKWQNRARCFNAGFLVSRRRILDLPHILALGERTRLVKDQFADAGDQGFLNYWIDHSDLTVQSVADMIPDVYDWNWADATYFTGQRDMYEIADRTGTFEGKRFAMIHWAGFGVSGRMPHRELFLKYRLGHASPMDHFHYHWAWHLRPSLGNIKRRILAPQGSN